MCLEGPEGSITKAGTDPELQGGTWWWRGFGGSHRAQPLHGERRRRGGKKVMGGGKGGPQDWLTNPDRKGFFSCFCRTHAVTGWCLNGVNTQEAYRETQTGLGIVTCKLQHCRGGLLVWGDDNSLHLRAHTSSVYEICIWTYISSCYQALHSCSNMLLYAVLARRGASVQYIVPAVPLLLFFPYSCRLYFSSFVFLLTTLLSSPKTSWYSDRSLFSVAVISVFRLHLEAYRYTLSCALILLLSLLLSSLSYCPPFSLLFSSLLFTLKTTWLQ